MRKVIVILLLIGLYLYAELQALTKTSGDLICTQATLTQAQLAMLEGFCKQSEVFESLCWYDVRETAFIASSGSRVQGNLYEIGGDISLFGISGLQNSLMQVDSAVLENNTANRLYRDGGRSAQNVQIDGKNYRVKPPLAPKGILQMLSQMEQYAVYTNIENFSTEKTLMLLFHVKYIFIARNQLEKLFEDLEIPYKINLIGYQVYIIRQIFMCIIFLFLSSLTKNWIVLKWRKRSPYGAWIPAMLIGSVMILFVICNLPPFAPHFLPSETSSRALINSLNNYAMYINQSSPLPTPWISAVNWMERFIIVYGILIGIVLFYRGKEKVNEETPPAVRA